jgi:hypothetical protein
MIIAMNVEGRFLISEPPCESNERRFGREAVQTTPLYSGAEAEISPIISSARLQRLATPKSRSAYGCRGLRHLR